ncbi:22953_t:CDS:2, partial [Gigaspora margarita]
MFSNSDDLETFNTHANNSEHNNSIEQMDQNEQLEPNTSQPVKFKTTTRTTSKHQGHLNTKSSKFGYHYKEKNKE